MALFEVLDPHAGPAPPGPWESRPAPAVSFSSGEAPAPLWRVNLPADLAVASAELSAAEQGLSRQEVLIAGAPERLRALAVRGGAVSFSAGAASPEARLVLLLNAPPERASSFSTAPAEDDPATVQERFKAFTQQVQDAVMNFAVIETRRDGALLARTAVSWTGDVHSLLIERSGEPLALHRRSLDLTLRSRAALLRSFATVVRGAAIVAVMAGSPVGAARALPAAWRFVNDLVEQVRGEQAMDRA